MSARKAGAPIAGLRMLTAADILGADDIVREEVPTPEWGEGNGVLVQSMTATQRFAWAEALTADRDSRTALIVCSVVNEQGEPILSMADVERLAEKNGAVIERIARVAGRLSRLRQEDREELSAGLKATNGSSHSGSQDI